MNKLYFHNVTGENKSVLFKYNSNKNLATTLTKYFGCEFSEQEIAAFYTNHFTIFMGRMVFGKSRKQIDTYIQSCMGDRYCGMGEEEEDEDYWIDLTADWRRFFDDC